MRYLASLTLALVLTMAPALAGSFYFSNCDDHYTGPDYGNGDTTWSQSKNAACGIPGNDGVHPINSCDCANTVSQCQISFAKGTHQNPYCLQPGNGVLPGDIPFDSFAQFSDPTSSFALSAGDTIYLCAGRCDGQGAATYYVQPSSGGNFLVPQLEGGNGSPITVRVYCAGTCDKVTLVGDTNADGQFQSGEVQTWLLDSVSAPSYWTFDGDPLNLGVQNLAFTKFNGVGFEMSNRVAHDFTVHGVEIQGDSPDIWGGRDMGPLQDQSHSPFCGQNGHYSFHIDNWTTGTISITHSYFHDLCSFAFRNNLNTTQAANALFVNSYNTFENAGAAVVNNAFSVRSFPASSIYTFSHNLLTDSGPVTFSDNFEHVVVTDNDIECPGNHGTNAVGGCGGITFVNGSQQKPSCIATCVGGSDAGKDCGGGQPCSGGTCSGSSDCAMDDILIARNRIRARSAPVANPSNNDCTAAGAPFPCCTALHTGTCAADAQFGGMETGISVNGYYDHSGATSWPTRFVIENNMISNVRRRYSSSNLCQAPTEAPNSGALVISTRTNGTIVRNNTIYHCDAPLMLCNDTGTPTGTIIDNLIYESTAGLEVEEQSGAAFTLTNNDINSGSQSGPVIGIGCASDFSGCSTTACTPSLSFTDSGSGGNICALFSFANIGPAPIAWDLHFGNTSSPAHDAGVSCSSDDFDGDARYAPCDIGADEIRVILAPPPPPHPEIRLDPMVTD